MTTDEHTDDTEPEDIEADEPSLADASTDEPTDDDDVEGFMMPTIKPTGILDGLLLPAVKPPATEVRSKGMLRQRR